MEQVFFKNIQHTIISELQDAQQSIQIAVCWFTNKAIFDILAQKASQGVSLSIILLDDYTNKRKEGLPLNDLIGLGVKLYFSDKMSPIHHKFCIIDNATLLTGSYDWTYFSESKAIDNLMLIKENQALIDAFAGEFSMLTSVLSPVSSVVPYTIAEGMIKDIFGLKHYLSDDVYLQALKADENGEDLNALNLMHHSSQIDEYKEEVQSEFIREKTTEKQAEEITEEVEQEEPVPVVYTSRGLGSISTPEPQYEEQEYEEPQHQEEEVVVSESLPQEEVATSEEIETTPQETINEAAADQVAEETQSYSEQQPTSEVPIENPTPEPIAVNPEAENLIQQGENAYQQGKLDEAVQLFAQAIMLQAENPRAYLNIAIVKWKQGKFGEQAEYAAQSIQYDATNNKAFNTLALAQDKIGNNAEAINNYTKALELSPDNYSYLWNRAVALKKVGRRQEALLDFGKVVKLCNAIVMSQPTNQNAKTTLTAAMREMGT
ncbi:MAG: tetratricopeptide repeat protein [Cytophagales bacterium]|nr:MAG: tetratricopeptide repeat protein [Cytophagales bacterium]